MPCWARSPWKKSLLAGIIGLGLVLLFMLAYYRMAGVVAALALVFYTIVVLAVFKLVPVTLGLSGIGAFILSIGLAVDANILIFERMKEEIRIGRTLSSSMEVGFSRAWPAIRDGNFSTIITCLVLLWLGSRTADDLVTGFAFTLLIGVAVSMFTAIVVSRNLLQLLAWIGLGRRLNLFSPEGSPAPGRNPRRRSRRYNRHYRHYSAPAVDNPAMFREDCHTMYNIVGKRGWYFLFSALLLIPGLISLAMPPDGWITGGSGLRPGIDFTSGSVLDITFERSVSPRTR